jgi:AraC-like DNA-binding protein
MGVKLRLREDMSEDVQYTSPNLPIYSVIWNLSCFIGHAADCHWHRDLEFILVLEGEMTYHVNGRLFPLARGDGIFVNSNQLHFGSPGEHGPVECVFRSLLIHPSLLCADPYIEGRFVNPLLYDTRYDTIFFPAPRTSPRAEDWREEASVKIAALAELCMRAPDDSALEVQSRLYELWSLFFTHTVAASEPAESGVPRGDTALKRMLSFIQGHYGEKINLDAVAGAGGVCRSKCCLLFKQALRQTVFEYLLHFRARRSLSLLADEALSITEVAAASGFSGPSYYGEIFKRISGISPGEYRRRLRAQDTSLPRF